LNRAGTAQPHARHLDWARLFAASWKEQREARKSIGIEFRSA
jgi:hypothetical protein